MLWINMLVVAIGLCVCKEPFRAHKDVRIAQGTVRGYRNISQAYFEFLGIPYAGAPVKSDRFKPPNLPPKWDGLFEATHKISCPQANNKTPDENCLIINVFMAVGALNFPVIVLVHDGDFIKGSGATNPPFRLVNDFVIVTFNYRLGALGFLCLGLAESSGNFGLEDQIAAINWVHKNIITFGGNPNKITVYATGSGAVSLHLLLISKALEGIIQRVVMESGSAISPFVLSYDPVRIAKTVLKLDNDTNLPDILNRYKLSKTTTLVKAAETTERRDKFGPCIVKYDDFQGNIIIDDPMVALIDGNYQQVPLLLVYTDESKSFTAKYNHIVKDDVLPDNLEFPNEDVKCKLLDMINEFYFKDDNKQMHKYLSDIVVYPMIKSAVLHAKKGNQPVFLMELSYENKPNIVKDNFGPIYGYLNAKEGYDQDEIAVTRLVTMFSNFAKYGDPTPITSSQVPIIWEPIRKRSEVSYVKVLRFGKVLAMKKPSIASRMAFWDKIFMTFYKPHIPLNVEDN